MKRSDSTTPRGAPWPPPAATVGSAIYAALMTRKVTPEEIEAVDGLPPAKFPDELMRKLGFNPPPSETEEPAPPETPPS